jgi:hypothetical protein
VFVQTKSIAEFMLLGYTSCNSVVKNTPLRYFVSGRLFVFILSKRGVRHMQSFDQKYEEWLQMNIMQEANPRRRGLIEKGLGHGTVEFLRTIWYPTVRNFDHLYPEWEVRDFGGYRYVDLAYRPGGMNGAIEIQGYGSHARDLDVNRFKDLCWRHSLMALDCWILLPVAYLSIKDEPWRCQQLILAFIGIFLSTEVSSEVNFLVFAH